MCRVLGLAVTFAPILAAFGTKSPPLTAHGFGPVCAMFGATVLGDDRVSGSPAALLVSQALSQHEHQPSRQRNSMQNGSNLVLPILHAELKYQLLWFGTL